MKLQNPPIKKYLNYFLLYFPIRTPFWSTSSQIKLCNYYSPIPTHFHFILHSMKCFTRLTLFFNFFLARLRTISHRPHCLKRKVMMLDVRETDDSLEQRNTERNRDGSSIDDSVNYFRPYLDSASWLYLETNPIMRIANPVMHPHVIEYAMPPPKRKTQRHRPRNNSPHRHHHHHHQHDRHCHHAHQHRHRRNHRRVASDPGDVGNWNGRRADRQHRRVISLGGNEPVAGSCLVEATITEASEETPSPDETTKTLTFRKVPWHPNLHMLKTRQT